MAFTYPFIPKMHLFETYVGVLAVIYVWGAFRNFSGHTILNNSKVAKSKWAFLPNNPKIWGKWKTIIWHIDLVPYEANNYTKVFPNIYTGLIGSAFRNYSKNNLCCFEKHIFLEKSFYILQE